MNWVSEKVEILQIVRLVPAPGWIHCTVPVLVRYCARAIEFPSKDGRRSLGDFILETETTVPQNGNRFS